MRLGPGSLIHRDTTIKNVFASISSMNQITAETICTKIHAEKNGNVLYALQQLRRENDITFSRISLIESMRNNHLLLYHVHMATYIQINKKWPCVTIIQFYTPIRFNIWRNFCARLSVRVSNSFHPINFLRKYCT